MRLRGHGVRTRVRAAWRGIRDTRHRLRVRRLAHRQPATYRTYLDEQLKRTLSKRTNDPGVGTRILVQHAIDNSDAGSRAAVLCVGCRNGVELDVFRSHGFENVVGIDLVSHRDDILVMDMHRMTFEADSFDIVYASHSLEHAFDVDTVVREIRRVARDGAVIAVEVPLRARKSDSDRIEFGDLAALRAAFPQDASEVLWSEEQPPGTTENDQGTDIARIVLRCRKSSSAVPASPAVS